MSNENNENKPVIFNTPAGFNFQETFAGLSIKFKPKVEFLIHQINYYEYKGGYQINFKNHIWFLGIKSTELSMMLCKLVECGLIRLTANFNPGNTSNTYRMVTPFNVDAPGVQKSFYYPQEITFIRKWVQDGYIVKNASTTSFVKELKTTVNASTIASQQKQINDLQAQVSALLAQISPGVPNRLTRVPEPVDMMEEKLQTKTTSEEKVVNNEPESVEAPSSRLSEEITQPIIPVTKNIVTAEEADLAELQSMFDQGTLPVSTIEMDTPPIHEAKTLEQFPTEKSNVSEKDNTAGINVDVNKTPDKETFRGNLTVYYSEVGLTIQQGDNWAALSNYDAMKPWCEKLPEFEKQRLYHHIISATGREVRFPLNQHTKALFTRELVNGDALITYKALSVE